MKIANKEALHKEIDKFFAVLEMDGDISLSKCFQLEFEYGKAPIKAFPNGVCIEVSY